jgi:hydrogenase expression/formation protein HypC
MCLAIPGQIDKLIDDQAEVVIGTNRYDVCTILTPEVQVGDWVLVHAGYSITRLDEQEARETYALIQQLQTEPPSEAAASGT